MYEDQKERKIIKISSSDRVYKASTSKGDQVKYKKNDYWIKEDKFGYEGLSESLISEFLKCVNNIHWFVNYASCDIILSDTGEKTKGCLSKDFCQGKGEYLSLESLLEHSLVDVDKLFRTRDTKVKIEKTIDTVKRVTNGYDISDYLITMLYLDAITGNEDRHINNLGVFRLNNKKYIDAPIYDNGLALLSDVNDYGNLPIGKALNKAKSKPFATRHKTQIAAFKEINPNFRLEISKSKYTYLISKYSSIYYNNNEVHRAKKVLDFGVRRFGSEVIKWV